MGIVARQGSKYMAVSIAGLAIATVSTLFIYPLDLETYGNIQFLISMARVVLPLITLGALAVPVKFYPLYSNTNRKPELIGLGLVYIILAFTIFLLLYPFIRNGLISGMERLNMDTDKFLQFENWIIFLSFLIGIVSFLQYYISNLQRIVIPGILVEFSIKIIVPCLVLWKIFSEVQLMTLIAVFVTCYAFILVFLGIYLKVIDSVKISWPGPFTRSHIRSILNYSSYGMMNALGINLIYRIDIIMITVMLGAATTGQYSIFLFIASVTGVPATGLFNISAPLVSQAFEKNDYESIDSIYKGTSMILMMVSGLIGVVIYAGLQPLFSFMENGQDFVALLGVWAILVLTKWIDYSTGMNMHIISYSRFYRYNLFFLVVFGIFTIGLNYLFIIEYGIMGAALATFISVAVYNVVKMLLIYFKLKIWPFTKESFAVIAVLAGLAIPLYFIPHLSNPFLDILIRCGCTGALGIYLFYKLQLSLEFNKLINTGINYILRY